MKRLLIILGLILLIFLADKCFSQVGAGIARVDSLEFETVLCAQKPAAAQVNASDYWAVFWEGADNDGFMATFLVTTAGVISNATVDTW